MTEVSGQLNPEERAILTASVLEKTPPPSIVLEVGTWLGGGSTLHFLRALQRNNHGHLFGIECDRSIYEQMIANIRAAAPEAAHRFTPLFGFSQEVLPKWIAEQPAGFQIDVAFLDGGNNPMEQIDEFRLIDAYMPVGSTLLGHDAKLRKGRWFVPYVSALDNWESQLHNISVEGLFAARKTASKPTPASLQRAEAALRKGRNAPVEVFSRLIGSSARQFLSRALPRSLVSKLSEGRSQ